MPMLSSLLRGPGRGSWVVGRGGCARVVVVANGYSVRQVAVAVAGAGAAVGRATGWSTSLLVSLYAA